MRHDDTSSARHEAVSHGLMPIVRIADDPTRWTMAERMERYGCPAVAVATFHDGTIDWADGFGTRTAGTAEPVNGDTVFMVASCSKPVTATLVLQQVAAGVLDLDTDVNRYLRRWQIPTNEFTANDPVTLRRMLSHTAGLTVNGWGVYLRDGRPIPSELDLLEGRPPSHMPPVRVDKAYDGTSRYSGGGFLLSQMLLEDVLGIPFAELAQRELFGPLGMTRTTFAHPLSSQFVDSVGGDIASGHGDDGTPFPGGWAHAPEMGAGGLCSSARDYARFLLAIHQAHQGAPNAVLPRELALEMATPTANGAFGLGFRVVHDGDRLRLNHGGSNDGYQTETNLFPELGDGAVVFTNSASGIFLFREVFNAIAEVYDWPDFGPAPKRLVALTEADHYRYVGSYRIVAGIELPLLRVWSENGRLWNEVPGLRFGVQEAFVDDQGVLFNQSGPFESRTVLGPDGRVAELQVFEGTTPVLSAVRAD
jgi:CubicO group peptidase (beta-lactamase class C family)